MVCKLDGKNEWLGELDLGACASSEKTEDVEDALRRVSAGGGDSSVMWSGTEKEKGGVKPGSTSEGGRASEKGVKQNLGPRGDLSRKREGGWDRNTRGIPEKKKMKHIIV